MFALPPIVPVGGFARTLLGPALSFVAVWGLMSAPIWFAEATGETYSYVTVAPEYLSPIVQQAYDGDLREASGLDDGKLVQDRILTSFNETPNHQLVGWYMVTQNGKTYEGTLSEGTLEPTDSGHLYHFHWADQFGTGKVDFRFDESYSKFDGNWDSDQVSDWHSTWSGSRR